MPDPIQSQPNPNTPAGGTPPGQPQAAEGVLAAKSLNVESLDIHAMPEKFLGIKPGKTIKQKPARKKKQSKEEKSDPKKESKDTTTPASPGLSGTKRQILIAVGVVVGVGAVMAAAAFFFVRSVRDSENTPEPIAVVTPTPAVVTPTPSLPVPTTPPVVTEQPVSETTPTIPQPTTPDPTPTPTVIAPLVDPALLDTDNDLLTIEEERLFGTTDTSSDFDGDGFLDGQEVLSMFDPRFGDGAILSDSTSVKTYVSSAHGYRLLVPTSWLERVGASPTVVRFVSDSLVAQDGSGEFVEVAVEPNTDNYPTVEEWYQAQFPGVNLGQVTTVPAQDITGIVSPDGLSVFFLTDEQVYTLSYTPSTDTNVYFETVFNMMARSFALFTNALEG